MGDGEYECGLSNMNIKKRVTQPQKQQAALTHLIDELVQLFGTAVSRVREVLVQQRSGPHPKLSRLENHALPK